MSGVNLVPNPRFHVNVSDFWSAGSWGTERVTSVPWGELPEGADACARQNGAGDLEAYPLLGAGILPYTFTFGARPSPPADPAVDACRLWAFITFYGEGPGELGTTWLTTGEWDGQNFGLDQWHTLAGSVEAPVGTHDVRFFIDCDAGYADGGLDTNYGYVTLVRLGGTEYKDGDSDGWAWDGAAHNSISREVVLETYGANVLINGGACVVFDPAVTLRLNPGSVAATEMAIRNDEDGYGAWEAFAATKAWTLSAACKVWAKFRDSA